LWVRGAAARRVHPVRARGRDRRPLRRERADPLAPSPARARRWSAKPMTMARMLASVLATTTGLAFWWGLTEPLPVPPAILLGVSAGILLCAGVLAGRRAVAAARCPLPVSR